jgi:ferredoxin-thioredoxin reductase catalytic subunit
MLNHIDYTDTYDPEATARRFDMRPNPERTHVIAMLEKLHDSHMRFGAPYCPCHSTHTQDTVCPCKYMREKKACRCGLYLRKEDENHAG